MTNFEKFERLEKLELGIESTELEGDEEIIETSEISEEDNFSSSSEEGGSGLKSGRKTGLKPDSKFTNAPIASSVVGKLLKR